jgi:hypothetical protein
MPKLARPFVSLALVVITGAPALATHGGIHPTFRTQNVYFHCTGPTKVHAINTTLAAGLVPWNTTAPAQSYTQGAGCGTLDSPFYHADPTTPYDASFRGTFSGNLKNLTVRLHNLLLGRARTGDVTQLGVRLSIDGQDYLPLGMGHGTLVDVTPTPSSTGATELLEFSITDIGSAKEIKDAQGTVTDIQTTGPVTEDGDGSVEREITLIVTPFYSTNNNAFVWDAIEIASGMTFNPATLAGSRVKATPPS